MGVSINACNSKYKLALETERNKFHPGSNNMNGEDELEVIDKII